MRTIFRSTLLLGALFASATAQAQTSATGIGVGTLTPDPSAALDVSSAKLGVLFPRVSLSGPADATTVAQPAAGLVVYNTATTINGKPQLVVNNGTTAAPVWAPFGAGNYWSLIGNTGTNAATNFLGTVDSVALSFRVNNRLQMQLQPGGALWVGGRNATANQFIGYLAGSKIAPEESFFGTTPAGTEDQFIGYLAGSSTTTGSQNQFIGSQAGKANTTGANNQFFGPYSGLNNTYGSANQFIGQYSGGLNTSGSGNQFIGYQAGYNNTTAGSNQFIGYFAGGQNTTGYYNQFLGYQAGNANTTGFANQYIGYQAAYQATTARYNAVIGFAAATSLKTGSNNLLLGAFAGSGLTTGTGNVLAGYQAGQNAVDASYNVMVGFNAGLSSLGTDDVYIGRSAGGQVGPGNQNTVVGSFSGFYAPAGAGGSNNALFGYQAGYQAGGANNNSYFGVQAGASTNSGTNNTAMGYQAGQGISSGSNNTIIGALADVNDQRFNKAVAIGYNAKAGADNVMALGGRGVDAVKVGIGIAIPSEVLTVQGNILASGTITQNSDRRLKTNVRALTGTLDGVNKLRGVRYTFLPGKGPEGEQLGVIAQEVEAVYPELVRTDATTGIKSVNYAQLTPVLLEAIKELETKVAAQASQLTDQARQQDATTASLEDLRTQVIKLQSSLGVVMPTVVIRK